MLFEIDPIIHQLNDERTIKLCNGQITQEEFMRLVRPDDPIFISQGKLSYVTKEMQEKTYEERNKQYKNAMVQTGGINGNVLFDNFDKVKLVYPELQPLYDEAKQKIDEEKDCKGCARGKYTNTLSTEILKLEPVDNKKEIEGILIIRDIDSLADIFKDRYPYAIRKLKKENLKVEDITDLPKHHYIKKDIPFKTDISTNGTMNITPIQNTSTPIKNTIINTENQFGIVRENCFDCVKKHLDDVYVLLEKLELTISKEEKNIIVSRIIGHLNEAADEAISKDLKMAERIRNIKLQVIG